MRRRPQCSKSLRFFLVLAMVAVSSSPYAADDPDYFGVNDLVGEWISDGCESLLVGVGRNLSNFIRHYVFSQTNFNVRYTVYSDTGCENPLFTFRIAGPYELGKARPELGRVREMLAFFDSVYVTAESEAGVEILKRGCASFDWTVGATKEVRGAACLAFKPREQCLGDYELARVEGGYFTPGYRSENMCVAEGRPTSIQSTKGAKKIRSP